MKIVLRATFVLGLGLFQTIVAYGQVPEAEIFGGYSYFNADTGDSGFGRLSLHGWGGSVTGNINSAFGITGQITGNYGTPSITTFAPVNGILVPVKGSADVSVYTVMVGPELSYRMEKAKFFIHPLVGIMHEKASNARGTALGVTVTLSDFGDSATNFAWDLGGGFDISLNSRMALRLFQVDYVGEKSTPVGTHFRAAAGVVFKF